MNKLKALIAVTLILPLAAWAAGQQAAPDSVVGVSAAQTPAVPVANDPAYECCIIVFMNGRYWCFPC
jgi:hypothetical protein